MITRGRIESDGKPDGTRVWLAGQEVSAAVQRIEWVIDARGEYKEAAVVMTFLADVEMNVRLPETEETQDAEERTD